MILKVIGTGSSGNCYLLQQGDDSLLLEAGLHWLEILTALPRGLRGIHACLLTHEHKDHSKSAIKMMKCGIKTVMSAGTWRAITGGGDPLDAYIAQPVLRGMEILTGPVLVKHGDAVTFPPFTVMAVKAMHDAAEPLAYLIRHDPTGETVLFATDTYLLPNRYPGINHWLVECNYIMEKAEALLETPAMAPLYDRLIRSHMSLGRLVASLKANDLSHTRTIVLIHISDERGDSPLMQETVRRETGIRTIAAKNGMEIQLGECPF